MMEKILKDINDILTKNIINYLFNH